MVQYCSVPMCKNSSYTPGVSFHRFPTNELKRKAWIIRMRRDENRSPKITKHSRVCSAHFMESDYKDLKNARKDLNYNAEPTIFPFPSVASKEPLYVLNSNKVDPKLKKKGIKWWPRKKRGNCKKVVNKDNPGSVIFKKSLEEIALISNATVSTITVGKQKAAIICPKADKENISSNLMPQAPTKVVLKFVPDVSSDKPSSYIPVFYVLSLDKEEKHLS